MQNYGIPGIPGTAHLTPAYIASLPPVPVMQGMAPVPVPPASMPPTNFKNQLGVFQQSQTNFLTEAVTRGQITPTHMAQQVHMLNERIRGGYATHVNQYNRVAAQNGWPLHPTPPQPPPPPQHGSMPPPQMTTNQMSNAEKKKMQAMHQKNTIIAAQHGINLPPGATPQQQQQFLRHHIARQQQQQQQLQHQQQQQAGQYGKMMQMQQSGQNPNYQMQGMNQQMQPLHHLPQGGPQSQGPQSASANQQQYQQQQYYQQQQQQLQHNQQQMHHSQQHQQQLLHQQQQQQYQQQHHQQHMPNQMMPGQESYQPQAPPELTEQEKHLIKLDKLGQEYMERQQRQKAEETAKSIPAKVEKGSMSEEEYKVAVLIAEMNFQYKNVLERMVERNSSQKGLTQMINILEGKRKVPLDQCMGLKNSLARLMIRECPTFPIIDAVRKMKFHTKEKRDAVEKIQFTDAAIMKQVTSKYAMRLEGMKYVDPFGVDPWASVKHLEIRVPDWVRELSEANKDSPSFLVRRRKQLLLEQAKKEKENGLTDEQRAKRKRELDDLDGELKAKRRKLKREATRNEKEKKRQAWERLSERAKRELRARRLAAAQKAREEVDEKRETFWAEASEEEKEALVKEWEQELELAQKHMEKEWNELPDVVKKWKIEEFDKLPEEEQQKRLDKWIEEKRFNFGVKDKKDFARKEWRAEQKAKRMKQKPAEQKEDLSQISDVYKIPTVFDPKAMWVIPKKARYELDGIGHWNVDEVSLPSSSVAPYIVLCIRGSVPHVNPLRLNLPRLYPKESVSVQSDRSFPLGLDYSAPLQRLFEKNLSSKKPVRTLTDYVQAYYNACDEYNDMLPKLHDETSFSSRRFDSNNS